MDKIKVLFVDDDMSLGAIVTLALEASGFEAHYQTSLAGVNSVVKELNPNIIVLDVEIGTKNGIDVVPEIQAVAPKTPILFVSSHLEREYMDRALGLGAVNYLKKPFEIEDLIAYIRRFAVPFHSKGLEIGMFHLKVEDNLLMKGEEIVKKLSGFECKLLRLLALNRNEVVTRERIEQELWEGTSGSEHSLNNYIVKLRKYIAGDKQLELLTVPKVGYKLWVK